MAERRKRAGHLLSKMRFLSAQLVAMLEQGRWLGYAAHANAMADRLAAGLGGIPGVRPVQPIEANELFLAMPEAMIAGLRAEGFAFHRWLVPPGETGPVVRMVTSFATAAEEVDVLVAAATALAAQGRVALVDEAGEERQGGRLAVLTAPGPRAAQPAILPFQIERDAGLDARLPRRLTVERLRGQALLARQLEAALHLRRQQPAGLDQKDVVVRAGVTTRRRIRRLAECVSRREELMPRGRKAREHARAGNGSFVPAARLPHVLRQKGRTQQPRLPRHAECCARDELYAFIFNH